MSGICILEDAHLCSVAMLERLCFREPWSENALRTLCRPGGLGVVIPDSDREGCALAYGGLTYVLDEASVTNIAVHPDHRRAGLGTAVVQALMQQAAMRGVQRIYLEVRRANAAAIALYRTLGFQTVGTRRAFYRFPIEDALVMQAELSPANQNEKD